MNANINPLKKIPHTNTRHMVLQVLAWMWCIVFSSYFGSMWVFGITTIAQIFLLAAIVVTVATFETAKNFTFWCFLIIGIISMHLHKNCDFFSTEKFSVF